MENKAEETEKGKGSTEQTKKYITTWRNKWITSSAGSIDDFIKIYTNLAEQMQKWKEKGIILDPDVIGGVGDDYAQFCTYDEAVALQEEFEEEIIEEESENPEENVVSIQLGSGYRIFNPHNEHYLIECVGDNGTITLCYLKIYNYHKSGKPSAKKLNKSKGIWFNLISGEYYPKKGPPMVNAT